MSDPFDELKSEVVNNLFLLKEQLTRARASMQRSGNAATSAPPAVAAPTRAQLDELLLSLQATREDADLLRNACRTLRRRLANTASADATSAAAQTHSTLAEREAFCEAADDELDRVQDEVETMQRNRMLLDEEASRRKRGGGGAAGFVPAAPTSSSSAVAAAVGAPSASAAANDGDDDQNDGRGLVPGGASDSQLRKPPPESEAPFGISSASHPQVAPRALAGIDNRDWSREAGMKRLRGRQARRAGDAASGDEAADAAAALAAEVEVHGPWLGRAIYEFNRFRDWAEETINELDQQQRLMLLGVLALLFVVLVFAVVKHNSGGSSGTSPSANSTVAG